MTLAITLSRYISIRFVGAIFAVLLLCLLLGFFADIVEFLRIAGKHGGVALTTLLTMVLLRLPSFAELILPFAVLIGSIGAFLMLSRSSELTVIRASGMSVWQFVLPGVVVAFVLGLLATTVFNPLAALARAEADRLSVETFKRGSVETVFKTKDAGAWLRQDGVDGQSIVHAGAVADQGLQLAGVSVIQYNKKHGFFERIEAEKAELRDGRWELSKAWVTWNGELEREPAFYKSYVIPTYLTPTQVRDSLGSVRSVSFWELPRFIEIADKAKLPATRHKLQYQKLLSRPFMLAVMVLLAATCSLRAFRFGNVQTMVISGLAAGFVFFGLAEVSANFGRAGLATPEVAAWSPPILATLISLTVLLHQEDG